MFDDEMVSSCLFLFIVQVLVLLPADGAPLDLKWLAIYIGVPKKRCKLASPHQCMTLFGAIPGEVPPLPLRSDVRVLCYPSLMKSREESVCLVASAGHNAYSLLIHQPDISLPALCTAASKIIGSSFAFEVLPDPDLYHASLDAAFEWQLAKRAAVVESHSDQETENFFFELTLDCTLQPLARRLRMIGVDTIVAGEVLREPQNGPRNVSTGIDRVKIDPDRVAMDLRTSALAGRLLVAPSHGRTALGPGAYRCASDWELPFFSIDEFMPNAPAIKCR
eukprot:SAG31_NODE_3668_length_4005_cov_1.850998_2_plen_278_part_00